MNKFRKTSFVMVLLLLFALLVMVGLSTSFAADRNITNATDGGISGAVNSSLANDKIIMSDGIYSGNNNKDITINKNLTITGSNKANTVIDLSGGSKLFTINSGVKLTLQNLTIKNAVIGNNSYLINNDGYLTMENCVVTDNSLSFNIRENTTYTSNDVLEDDSYESGYLVGNNGQMNIIDTTFINNNMNINYQSYETVPYTNTTTLYFNNTIYNSSVVGSGFIVNKGRLNITRSEFTNNTIKTTTNREYNWNNDQNITINIRNPNNGTVIGEQTTRYIYAMIVNTGDLIITQSNFQNNINNYNETRNYNKNITITTNGGSGKTTTNAGFYNLIFSNANLNIKNSEFTSNKYNLTWISNNLQQNIPPTSPGGAISIGTDANGTTNANINSSTFNNNTGTSSGAISIGTGVYGTTNVNIANSNFSNNIARIYEGGAIRMSTSISGNINVNITSSTFNNNTAAASGGGGIYAIAGTNGTMNVNITSSIFNNNTAATGAGAISIGTDTNGTTNANITSSTFNNNIANSSGAISIGTGVYGTTNVNIANSNFSNNIARIYEGGAIRMSTSISGNINVNITSSTFNNNTAATNGGGIFVTTNANGTVSADIHSSSFINNTANYGGGIFVTTGTNGNVSVVVNYNAFLNQSTSTTIHKASASSAVVNANYNYWGFNGLPSLGNVVVNSYYVLGITNMSDLGADYTVGDLLSFNYTVYLNGTSDSTNASNLPSLNSIFYNDLLYGYFSLNAPGIIQVPVQTVAGDVFNFTNANGTVIGNFTLTGTIYPGSVSNITVPEIIIVNNTSVDLVISIPTSVGDLAGQTFNVTINGQTQTVAFTNGTGTFVGYQYGNLGLNSLNITLSDNPNYNNSSAINNVFFKEETNINANVNDTIYGENATIVINTITNGQTLPDGTYTVILNGVEYNVTFTNGIGQVILSGLNAGEYNYTIIFNSTDKYTESETNITINVIKANVNIGVNLPSNATYGGNSTISGNLTTNGSLLDGTYNITVTINGVEYNVTVIDGLWSLTIPNTNVGIANVDIFFSGNNNYNDATIATNYTVNPKNLGTKITITSTRNGNKITYKITLKDNQGNTLANQNLSLTIAGKTVSLRTNSQGIAQYTYTATKAGKYYANAAYNGLNTENIIYGSSSAKSNTISITKTSIKIYLIKVSAKTVKYHGKRYRVYYKTYYIKNYGILTGSKLF
ncbi:beta strand repeat-containing protein, partial [Methanobrevibacter cuticularis]|uniref:beta strand repeat-containing protein n=1 Tax=Methanobrevibacter cuticularis TaxID=47311 RepID=UPI000A562A4E